MPRLRETLDQRLDRNDPAISVLVTRELQQIADRALQALDIVEGTDDRCPEREPILARGTPATEPETATRAPPRLARSAGATTA